MSCECETRVAGYPAIGAGLSRIPRQVAGFEVFRRAMLAGAPTKHALRNWRARDDDFGLMFIELWAYASEILAFYDETIAHEAYVRTARLDPSVRKLVALLGYLPRPATASRVALVVFAEGRLTVPVAEGAAARSGAFDDQPPQRFELPLATTVHPLANRWSIEPPRRATVAPAGQTTVTSLYLDPSTARAKAGELLLVQVAGDDTLTQIRRVATAEKVVAADGDPYVLVTFEYPITVNAALASQVRLSRVNERIGLWSQVVTGSSNPAPVQNIGTTPVLTLDGLYRQVRRNDVVLVSRDGEYRWSRVTGVADIQMVVVAESSIVVDAADNAFDSTVTVPAIFSPATQFTFDASLNSFDRGENGNVATTWAAADSALMLVHYGLTSVGRVVVPAASTIGPLDALKVRAPIERPIDGWTPSRFVLVDRNGSSVDTTGEIDFDTRVLALDETAEWTESLVLPVDVYGNVIESDRGETVAREVLGSGDASVASQEFVLKKAPLTHLPVTLPDGTPYTSTLEVWVDDVQWTEVRSFFGRTPDEAVYIVRQDDEQKSHVVFGDGVRARRLPTGKNNVRAGYRFGAGAAAPPARSVSQIAAPIAGVKSWWNPQAAFGGGEAEPSSGVRVYAPRSALVLGRAVSLADMEAVAASVAGVRAVRADWHWHETQQRPVARIWYIGLAGVADLVAGSLRTVCDPSVAIDVQQATAVPSSLAIDVAVDDRYDASVVATAVRDRLFAPEIGCLTPERIGIGGALVRSRLFAEVLAVEGTVAVRAIVLDGVPIDATVVPAIGAYFDFETGELLVNGASE